MVRCDILTRRGPPKKCNWRDTLCRLELPRRCVSSARKLIAYSAPLNGSSHSLTHACLELKLSNTPTQPQSHPHPHQIQSQTIPAFRMHVHHMLTTLHRVLIPSWIRRIDQLGAHHRNARPATRLSAASAASSCTASRRRAQGQPPGSAKCEPSLMSSMQPFITRMSRVRL